MRISVMLAALATIFALSAEPVDARTFHVGPGQEYAKVSQIAGDLMPGDVVIVTGDIVDRIALRRHGTATDPVTIRGRVVIGADGLPRRPRILPMPPVTGGSVTIESFGNHYVIEGLEFVGEPARHGVNYLAIRHASDNLVIANCVFRHFNWKAIVGRPEAGSITVRFCEFDSNGRDSMFHSVDIFSNTPGAVALVEHCWFHDATGGVMLKSHAPRTVIRCNWFENFPYAAVSIVDRLAPPEMQEIDLDCPLYPMHADIVGNVFVQGSAPGSQWSILSLGGEGRDAPGTEGDFNIAHNIFVTSRMEGDPTAILVQGNVHTVRIFNNALVSLGGQWGLYTRGETWDTPRTSQFVSGRGARDAAIEGARNWISTGAHAPEQLRETLSGASVRLENLLDLQLRPRADSPLAGAGARSIGRGATVDLVPEYEPVRGLALEPAAPRRRAAAPPSIGPFETRSGSGVNR